MTTTLDKTTTGSDVVSALESAYEIVRARHSELPAVVINIGTGIKGRGQRWGHFHHDRWVDAITQGRIPELFIAGERLACGAELTLQTLLHEAAHALGAVRGIKNTSGTSNKYHNRKFRDLAAELTLVYNFDHGDPVLGYSEVEITDTTREVFADALTIVEGATKLFLDGGGGTGGRTKTKPKDRNLIKATCSCDRIIRASRAVLDGAPITCGECGYDFYEVF